MKQLTFAVPNSVSGALYEIENLSGAGKLGALSSRVLEMFYVMGWDDGFVQFSRHNLCRGLGANLPEMNRAIDELEGLCLVTLRSIDMHLEVAEINSLSTPVFGGMTELCWWQYYRVRLADIWYNSEDARGYN